MKKLALVAMAVAACSDNPKTQAKVAPSTPDASVTADAPHRENVAANLPFEIGNPDATFDATLDVLDGGIAAHVPVAGAVVSFGGATYTSDANGKILIPGVRVRNTTPALVRAQGFLSRSIVLDYASAGAQTLRVALLSGVIRTVTASSGGDFAQGPAKVSVPANGFVDATGVAVAGDVRVTMLGIDPVSYVDTSTMTLRPSFDEGVITQGFDIAIRADGSVSFLAPESTFQIEMTDADGKDVDVARAAGVSATFKLSTFTEHKAGESLRLYRFDVTTQSWREDGTCAVAVVDGATTCTGTLSRAGTWGIPTTTDSNAVGCSNLQVQLAFGTTYPATVGSVSNPVARSTVLTALPSVMGYTYKPRFKSADGTFFLSPAGETQVEVRLQALRLDGGQLKRDTLRYKVPSAIHSVYARDKILEADLANIAVPPVRRFGCIQTIVNVPVDQAEVLASENVAP